MRFFFTQQSVQKLPKGFPGKARPLKKIGVDGIDGYMGNAIGWLALEAGYEVVGHVPLPQFAAGVPDKLRAKYERAVKKGSLSAADVERKDRQRHGHHADRRPLRLRPGRSRRAWRTARSRREFYRALGAGMKTDGLVASNSSSMGPGLLGADFAAGGGDRRNMLNLHFFSPAEHPMMQLVEVIAAKETTPDAVATAHAFVRSINKTPVILQDGSPGFLVNAGLAAYMLEAEKIYREGTPVAAIDEAMRAAIFPMGPFELGDQAGLDIAAGMFDTIAAAEKLPVRAAGLEAARAEALRHQERRRRLRLRERQEAGRVARPRRAGAGPRQPRRAADEIVERCARALYRKARELCDRKIVGSEEECDLAFVFGIGFAMYLGGPIFYGKQRGW